MATALQKQHVITHSSHGFGLSKSDLCLCAWTDCTGARAQWSKNKRIFQMANTLAHPYAPTDIALGYIPSAFRSYHLGHDSFTHVIMYKYFTFEIGSNNLEKENKVKQLRNKSDVFCQGFLCATEVNDVCHCCLVHCTIVSKNPYLVTFVRMHVDLSQTVAYYLNQLEVFNINHAHMSS